MSLSIYVRFRNKVKNREMVSYTVLYIVIVLDRKHIKRIRNI